MQYNTTPRHQYTQVAGLIVENTFLSIEDMAGQLLPPLALLVGSGRPCNFLVTNKWRNAEALPRVTDAPVLLMASRLVRSAGAGGERRVLRMGWGERAPAVTSTPPLSV